VTAIYVYITYPHSKQQLRSNASRSNHTVSTLYLSMAQPTAECIYTRVCVLWTPLVMGNFCVEWTAYSQLF